MVTQKDIELLMQSNKELFYRLELLNQDLKVIDNLEGNLISDNISISADSDIRRTYTCELIVTDSSFTIGKDKKIWFDKRIRPYIGMKLQRTQEIVWYCLGTFLYTNENYNYDVTSRQLSLICEDMMCLLNDTRSGQLGQYTRVINRGSDARSIIISLLNEVGIHKYYIEFNKNNETVSTYEIPYEMTYNAGTTAYTIIKDIVDLYAGTQMYFDLDGTFIISKIPTGKNEITILNDEILQPILISEQLTTSLSNIYNHIIIWGKVNEPDFYGTNVTLSGSIYYANVIESKLDEDTNEMTEYPYKEYVNFDLVALHIPSTNLENMMININSLGNIPVVDLDNKPLAANYLNANTDCVFRYRSESNDFLYVGQYQCYGEAYLTNNILDNSEFAVINEDNDFSVEIIGHKLKTLSGGDYDKIYTNSLCRQRCRYELYNATNMQDTMTLNVIPIPFLDVNQKIQFTSNSTKETHDYLVTNISCNYSEYTMTLNLSRYYPTYI